MTAVAVGAGADVPGRVDRTAAERAARAARCHQRDRPAGERAGLQFGDPYHEHLAAPAAGEDETFEPRERDDEDTNTI